MSDEIKKIIKQIYKYVDNGVFLLLMEKERLKGFLFLFQYDAWPKLMNSKKEMYYW